MYGIQIKFSASQINNKKIRVGGRGLLGRRRVAAEKGRERREDKGGKKK